MNKGFTLIELLAVVTLIALLSVLAIPNITKNINNKKNEISEINKKIIENATDIYIEKNPSRYIHTYEANGSTYCIPIQSLINDDILETPIKDENGNEIDYSKIVKATYSHLYNGFEYEIVENNQCIELINYVNRPEILENMIPVVYDEENNTWIKADINSKWYNYSEKNWANAVLVKEHKTIEYENSKGRYEYINSPVGTPIQEKDILAHFVWIPRFRYQILGENETTINIVFESISTPKSIGNQEGQWLTHPAFSNNNIELSGIWISKYESSKEENNIIIKDNKTPLTNIHYNDAYNLSVNMTNQNNIYGFNNVNTHLTLNSEWSAITYLTNSKYGINQKIASSTEQVTGKSVSTTGNITGVYDMSGISSEFVTLQTESEESYGYGFIETKTWYDDDNIYITQTNPYIIRGSSSIFNYQNSIGLSETTSFRVTLINSNSITEPTFYREGIVTTGEGLYQTIDNTFIYKGQDPNNYVWLDENNDHTKSPTELYRIISYENDGTIKVIRNSSIGSMAWDSRTSETEGLRKNSSNTYCNYTGSYYGCNVWGSKSNTYINGSLIGNEFNYKYYANNTSTTLENYTNIGTITIDSSLSTYLNETWLNSKDLSKYIEPHEFEVGGIYYFTTYNGGDKGITKEKQEEQSYKWIGNIGLINVTEYMEASTNPECTSVYSNYYYNPNYYYDNTPDDGVNNPVQTQTNTEDWPCGNPEHNWLSIGINEWTITPLSKYRYSSWHIHSKGSFTHNRVYMNNHVRPVFYLKSSTIFNGSGTIDNPYEIVAY